MKFLKTTLVILSLASASAVQAAEDMTIRLATTTSTYHSGLLDYLLPVFKKKTLATALKFWLQARVNLSVWDKMAMLIW